MVNIAVFGDDFVIEESETTKENKIEIEAKTKEGNKDLVQDPKKPG